MSDADKPIHCDKHGETPATFMCCHLLEGVGCGFHCSDDEPGDRWPDAWCDACEAQFQREGAWSDEHPIKLLCTGCYEKARARNARVPPPIAPGQLSVSSSEFEDLATAAFERCEVVQEMAKRRWKFGDKNRWHFDDETMTLRFFDDPKGEAVVADVAITGSLSTRTNTWMWVWGNDQYDEKDRAKIDPVRVFGEVRGIEKLASAHWPGDEVDAWEMTQLAADLLGAEAIYRAPFDHMLIFMLLDNFRMEHPS